MIARAALTLTLACLGACGGAVFTIGPEDADGGDPVTVPPPGDDGHVGVSGPDADADTHAPPDGGPAPAPDAAKHDAPAPSDDASCAMTPTAWTCSFAAPSEPDQTGTVYAPSGYCGAGQTYGLQTNLPTPPACLCPGHYTCACVLAALAGKCPFGNAANAVLACDDVPSGGPRVTCAH